MIFDNPAESAALHENVCAWMGVLVPEEGETIVTCGGAVSSVTFTVKFLVSEVAESPPA